MELRPLPGLAVLINRALLIVNPGARRASRVRAAAVDAFRVGGCRVEVATTQARDHATELARNAAGAFDAVFVLGGDGTVNEVLRGLAGTGTPLGVLAGGTGNLLARAMGIALDVRRAVPQLLGGTHRRIDLGRLETGRYFAVACGTGIDTTMLERVDARWRRRAGFLAYFHSALRATIRPERFPVRVEVDGRVIEREDCIGAMIVNVGSVLGGLFHLGPDIRCDDGRLDVCVYRARSLPGAARMFSRMVLRDFGPDSGMTFAAGRRVRLETGGARSAQVDGELLGSTPLVASVASGAATLVVPRPRRLMAPTGTPIYST